MNYVYINKDTNIVESVITTDLDYDKNSNLQDTQYCIEKEFLTLNMLEFKYKYENDDFTIVERNILNQGLSVLDRMSAIEETLLMLLGGASNV